jgi:polyisoprenoid-binding protein YceI
MQAKTVLSLAATVLVLLPGANAADTYKVDPAHTRVGFSIRHMGISHVKGVFDEFEGALVLDKEVIKEASATIQVKSVNTRVHQRDNHLRGADFFDAAKYPVITFKTKRVESSGGQTRLIGDFTMHGVTKELVLPVTLSGPVKDPQGNVRIGLEAGAKLNRKDYGINYSAALVGVEVAIEINAEAIKQTAGDTGNK